MRKATWLAVLAGVLMTGCGGDGDTAGEPTAAPPETTASVATESTPAETTVTETTTTETTATGVEGDEDGDGLRETQTFRGELGETFTLVGSQSRRNKPSDETIEVTVLEIVGPFSGFDLQKGNQLIGITVRIKNLAEKPYKDPQPGGDLIASGESGRQTSLITGTGENPCDNPRLKLEQGESATVCIAYEVPKANKPQTFTFAASHGYGDVGIWKLG